MQVVCDQYPNVLVEVQEVKVAYPVVLDLAVSLVDKICKFELPHGQREGALGANSALVRSELLGFVNGCDDVNKLMVV